MKLETFFPLRQINKDHLLSQTINSSPMLLGLETKSRRSRKLDLNRKTKKINCLF